MIEFAAAFALSLVLAAPVVPPLPSFQADNAPRMPISVGVPDVAGGRCPEQRFRQQVAQGVVTIVVRPRAGSRCAIWLGLGATTTSPTPTTYCELNTKSRRLVIRITEAGPTVGGHPDCAPTGFVR